MKKSNNLAVFKVIAVLLWLLGVWLLLGGSLPGVVGAGGHSLDGWERLLGLIPVIVGWLFWLGSSPRS